MTKKIEGFTEYNRPASPLISFGDRDQSRNGGGEGRSEDLLHTPWWSIEGEIKAKLKRHLTDSREFQDLWLAPIFDWATFLTTR